MPVPAVVPSRRTASEQALSALARPPLAWRHHALPPLLAIWPGSAERLLHPSPVNAVALSSHALLNVGSCLQELRAMIGRSGWTALLSWLPNVVDTVLIVVEDCASAADLGQLVAQPALCRRLLVVLHISETGSALLDSQAVKLLQQQSAFMPIRCDTDRLESCVEQVLRGLRDGSRRRHDSALLVGVDRLPGRPLLNLVAQLAEIFGPVSNRELVRLVQHVAPELHRLDVQRAVRLAVATRWLQTRSERPEMLSRNPQLPLFAGANATQRLHRLQQLRLQVMAARLQSHRFAAMTEVTGHVAA